MYILNLTTPERRNYVENPPVLALDFDGTIRHGKDGGLVQDPDDVILFEDVEEFEKCMEDNNKPDNLGDFIMYLSEKKHICGFVFSQRWFDIGAHSQLKQAREEFK